MNKFQRRPWNASGYFLSGIASDQTASGGSNHLIHSSGVTHMVMEMKAAISEKNLKMILLAVLMLGFTLFYQYETFRAGAFSIGAQAAEIVHGK